MNGLLLVADSYFDGEQLHEAGPFTIEIVDGEIDAIHRGDVAVALCGRRQLTTPILRADFVMPGLVEPHCHVFLNGAELDFEVRKQYLAAPFEQMMTVARQSVRENIRAGVTLIRDAGDLHGVNLAIRQELQGGNASSAITPEFRCPGRAIRKKGRYGSFMATEVTDAASLVCAIRSLAATGDDLKILLTGIIDFEKAEMKGGVQFDLEETRLIVRTARELGKLTYAHCSGLDGLEIAVEAGIDSIEHGFFMTREILQKMADKGIAWVPTFSPVYFQADRPHLAGWNSATVQKLDTLLQNHFEQVAHAYELGVPVIPGSDAGSYGVPHGTGLIDELFFHRKAGVPVQKILVSATSLPRRLWKSRPADIRPGNRANLLCLEGSPFEHFDHLRRANGIVLGDVFEAVEVVL